jgi:hypothetical protein
VISIGHWHEDHRWPGVVLRGLRPAIELAGNTAETAYLTRRRDQLG